MSTVAQNYYGVRCVMSVSGDSEDYAREELARRRGFDKVPPAGIDVTKDTDQSTFTRFLYDEFGIAFADIIDNMVLTDSKNTIRYIFKDTETEVDATEEQKCYLMTYYKDEVEKKLKSLKGESEAVEEETIKDEGSDEIESDALTDPIVSADESETIKDKRKPSADEGTIAYSTVDPSKMHIPDDGFMQTATADKPIDVTVEPEKETVNLLESIGMFGSVQPDQYFMPDISNEIYASFPYLKDLETKITAGGGFKVSYEWASGLLRVKVSPADKPNELLEKYSLTLDLNGYVVTPGAKWWPGVNHKTPVDYQKAYRYDLSAIEKYLAGEEIPNEFVCFDENVATLNKSIDLRSVFNIKDMTDDDAKYVFVKMKDVLKKLSTRLNKEYPKARFRISQYTNKDNFEIEAADDVYTNVGGILTNTTGTAAKIQVAGNKQPKLFK